MKVTLTFDNGPTAPVTAHVLDVLAQHDLRCTFFVVGENLKRPHNRAVAERAQAEGHWIGNHTLTHTVQFGDTWTHLQQNAYTTVLWNSVPHDWEDPDGWTERCLSDVVTRDWSLVVLHDLPTTAMDQLPRFLAGLRELDAEIVQDFPSDCVPLRRGRLEQPVGHLLPHSRQ
ncbi:polysaccharide deacetylase family protein [Streptomyces arenae]|uniref:polysaccharide deacetylase family protein n=1 Tax=Streptomyces arenae TaxID=29301 RepID=UPI002658714B|nr:polysaccharide deacetylase family protein [Streptomyces arenae]MCG7206607.1 polysaccharide deacetylase family protein [Streptomyces arenae]